MRQLEGMGEVFAMQACRRIDHQPVIGAIMFLFRIERAYARQIVRARGKPQRRGLLPVQVKHRYPLTAISQISGNIDRQRGFSAAAFRIGNQNGFHFTLLDTSGYFSGEMSTSRSSSPLLSLA